MTDGHCAGASIEPEWLQQKGLTRVTAIILAINIGVFIAMVAIAGIKTLVLPGSQTLLQWGASSGSLTLFDGQYWRLIGNAFVHVGIVHLLMNCYVLFDVGPLVERLYGSLRFLAIYTFCAIAGAFASILWQPTQISAGASGAIFGIFAALMAFFIWHKKYLPEHIFKLYAKIVVVLVLYSIAYGVVTKGVDNAAHLGGLLGGLISGLTLMPQAPNDFRWRWFNGAGAVVVVACVAAVLVFETNRVATNPAVIADSFYRKGVDLLRADKYEAALPFLDRAISYAGRIDSKDASLFFCDRARALQKLKRNAQAVSDCAQAISLDSQSDVGYFVRAALYHDSGDDVNSVKDLTRLIEIDPKNAMAYNNRAWSYDALGDYQKAIDDCNTALKIDPGLTTAYDTRGMAYVLLKKYDDALNDFNKAIAQNKKDGAYPFHRALVYHGLGKRPEESADVALAARLGYTPEKWEPKRD